MAFDGIVIANLAKELNTALSGGRINKIAQPEKDELLLTIKNQKDSYRLLLSASASLPLAYLTDSNKQAPLTAPSFCMLLRKHIGSARIISITQPDMERILVFEFEHLDELGDLCRKKLIVELMGKHSNIIFCKEDGMIVDSIKHISGQVSSVREVLPGREYFIPQIADKQNPLTITEPDFLVELGRCAMPLQKALYSRLTGISPVVAAEICQRAGLDGDLPANERRDTELLHLYRMLRHLAEDIEEGRFTPNIISQNGEPVEFASIPLTCFEGGTYETELFDSVSSLLETYYQSRSMISRIKQKSSDLRKIIQTTLERSHKKYDLQLRQLKDTEKKEKHRIYGELLNTYGYELQGKEKELVCLNYYDGQEITIPLDPELNAQENARKQFNKYNKLKRTYEALTGQIQETKAEIEHLESIRAALDIALKEEDLVQIKEELTEYGYIKRRTAGTKKMRIISKPFHYLSSDGFHIYVGKNNYQNEEVTFKLADGNDWWFHAKGTPGSHVIVKTEGQELPDRVFEEAGALAAYYSSSRSNDKVEIDYIQRKSVKKAAGKVPGFVVYHNNYSLIASPKLELKEI